MKNMLKNIGTSVKGGLVRAGDATENGAIAAAKGATKGVKTFGRGARAVHAKHEGMRHVRNNERAQAKKAKEDRDQRVEASKAKDETKKAKTVKVEAKEVEVENA